MSRALTIVAIVVVVGLAAWVGPNVARYIRDEVHWGDVASDMERARPYARQFALQLQQDARFTNIEIGVWGHGNKGPLYVRGRTRSDSEAAELQRSFDALHCPVGVSWQVVVDTNMSGGSR